MERVAAVVILCVVICSTLGQQDLSFPPGFKFGAATAAYQVEGAWNVSDKSPSIWDTLVHKNPSYAFDGSNGDVACDSYHLWQRDVEIAKELGLHFYRFSISWPRLLPSGFANHISEDGKNYYNQLIDGLLQNGIEPIVTLYHWDLPQRLQDLGGWTNPLVADWFANYARIAYSVFGDRVKTWLTINEPFTICGASYGGLIAPLIKDPQIGMFLCNKNILLAHAKAFRVYDQEFRPVYNGKVSLANHFIWFESATPELEALAESIREFYYGRFCHPIFSKEGGWPTSVEKQLAENSKREGYPESRLPAFTEEERNLIRGSYDFLGFNHYTSWTVQKHELGQNVEGIVSRQPEYNVTFGTKPEWGQASSFWFRVNPEGIRKSLVWLKEKYGNVEILITENGYSAAGKNLNDDVRVQYFKDYLQQVLLAIKEDGVNVSGYTAWTLIDNFEWLEGYTTNFGLYHVNFEDPSRPRVPRKSARYYSSIIQAHSLDVPEPHDEL